MKTDLHSHLLFGIDDGCRKAEETAAVLSHLQKKGIQNLAFTPHFYTYEQSLEKFCASRAKSFSLVKELPEAVPFRFSLGAEVYFTREIFNWEDLSPLCYENTDLMLVELEYGAKKMTDSVLSRLELLIRERQITPVLAHIDRYDYLYKDASLLRELKSMGCLMQVNLFSFASFFRGRTLLKVYEEGFVDFLGTDLHRSFSEEVWEKAEKKLTLKAPKLMLHTDAAAERWIFTK